jgi:hypothetical protein
LVRFVQVTKEEYQSHGSVELGERLAAQLRQQGHYPYIIPVGGSNSLGCWGYIQMMAELQQQTAQDLPFTHIISVRMGATGALQPIQLAICHSTGHQVGRDACVGAALGHGLLVLLQACGSGATLGGLALGNALSGYGSEVIGYGICDDEDYFYDFINDLYAGLGSALNARDILTMVQARGAGYAISRCASASMPFSAHTKRMRSHATAGSLGSSSGQAECVATRQVNALCQLPRVSRCSAASISRIAGRASWTQPCKQQWPQALSWTQYTPVRACS